MNILQLYNSIISIAVVIFKYLLSMHGIAKLQSIPWFDCNSNTETFSSGHGRQGNELDRACPFHPGQIFFEPFWK